MKCHFHGIILSLLFVSALTLIKCKIKVGNLSCWMWIIYYGISMTLLYQSHFTLASYRLVSDTSWYVHVPPGGNLQSVTPSNQRYIQVHHIITGQVEQFCLLVICRLAMRATVTSWSSCVLPVKSWWEQMNRNATMRENVQRGHSTANTAKNLSCWRTSRSDFSVVLQSNTVWGTNPGLGL